jgi:hypothetical protein
MRELSYLEGIILQAIKAKQSLNNVELYELTLLNEFLPKHTLQVLKKLRTNNKIREVNHLVVGYGINYTNYKKKSIISKFEAL